MKEKIKITIIIFFIFIFGMSVVVLATKEEDEYIKKIAERMEIDGKILEKLNEAVEEEDFEEFFFILGNEYNKFQDSYYVYKNRPQGLSDELVEIATRLEKASFEISEGVNLLISLPEDYNEEDFFKGMNLIISGIEKYEELAEIVEEWEKKYKSTRNIYLYGTIFGLGGFLLFLVFSLKKPETLGLKLIRNGFGFIGLGFGITLAGYLWMSGGTYYILWGLPIYGGYLILKGISLYFKKEDNTEEIYERKN